jgi:hypothetical protein
MTTTQILLLVLLVVVVVAVLAALAARRRKRSAELRSTFGPEYDRTVEGSGKRRDAERELAERKERHDSLQIRPLSEASRTRYLTAWDGVQNRFIDSPVLALSEADALVTRMLGERGFPTDDTRSAADMLSVKHAGVLDDFRAGHEIEQANSTDRANTEQVRQGMLHFRRVFEELVSDRGDQSGSPAPVEHQQDGYAGEGGADVRGPVQQGRADGDARR